MGFFDGDADRLIFVNKDDSIDFVYGDVQAVILLKFILNLS